MIRTLDATQLLHTACVFSGNNRNYHLAISTKRDYRCANIRLWIFNVEKGLYRYA